MPDAVVGPLDATAVQQQRGEAAEVQEAAAAAEVGVRLAAGGSLSRVAKEVAAEFGVAKSKVYAEALRQRQEGKAQRGRERGGDADAAGAQRP